MNNNYKFFDMNGLLIYGYDTPISKGNNAVDIFYFHFDGYDYRDTYVTVAVTLPDGTSLPELATSNADFYSRGNEYKGFKFVLLEPLTAQAGNLSMTIKLMNKRDDMRLCSAKINVTIHDSDTPTDNTITDVQYQQLLEAMTQSYNEIDANKLSSNFNKYESVNDVIAKDIIAINRDGEVKNIEVDNIYNIKTINNISPVDKNINLDSSDIPFKNGNVNTELERINTELTGKIGSEEVVFHLGTELVATDELSLKGLIPHTVENKKVDDFDFGIITLTDTDFVDGDIVTIDMICIVDDVLGETNTKYFSFTRVIEKGFQGYIYLDGISFYLVVGERMLSIRGNSQGNVTYTPKIQYSLVRR